MNCNVNSNKQSTTTTIKPTKKWIECEIEKSNEFQLTYGLNISSTLNHLSNKCVYVSFWPNIRDALLIASFCQILSMPYTKLASYWLNNHKKWRKKKWKRKVESIDETKNAGVSGWNVFPQETNDTIMNRKKKQKIDWFQFDRLFGRNEQRTLSSVNGLKLIKIEYLNRTHDHFGNTWAEIVSQSNGKKVNRLQLPIDRKATIAQIQQQQRQQFHTMNRRHTKKRTQSLTYHRFDRETTESIQRR